MNAPHSPFATRLSGSAKETELRIRSIFQWKKKRPPVILIILALLVVALCGSLVGFTITAPDQPPAQDPIAEASPSAQDSTPQTTDAAEQPTDTVPENTAPPPETPPFPYLQEVLNTLSPSTPLVIADIQDLDWNGKAATVVTAGNVTVTGDESTLYTPGEPSAAPNPPHARDTIMYSMGVLFVEGCEPVELYRRVYPISNSEDSVSYLPPSTQSYQQIYSVTQYDAVGQTISCPVFMDHGGELNIRYFKYAPAYSLQDATGDGIPEFIFSLDCQSSLMSQYAVYQLTNGAPRRIPTTAPDYRSVLLDNGAFSLNGTNMTLAEYTAGSSAVRMKPTRFAVLDLDGDGQNEVVVWIEINSTAETLILHEQSGIMFGYSMVYRGFMDLKADGTFSWSGSAFRNGTARLSFFGPEAVSNYITYCDVPIDSDSPDKAIFVVDGAAATAEEFTAAITAQGAKPDADWHDLTEENIRALLP